jgi:hypothetical protein
VTPHGNNQMKFPMISLSDLLKKRGLSLPNPHKIKMLRRSDHEAPLSKWIRNGYEMGNLIF